MGAGQVHAGVINTSDRGWYNASGDHTPTNDNYSTGALFGELRNFFVFDLSGISTSQTFTSASLRLFYPVSGLLASDGTYSVYDVTTSVPSLTAGGSGLVGTFDDLGTGTSYGTQATAVSQQGTFVTVNLNADGLSALNAARGGFFATGGTFSGSGTFYLLFGSSGSENNNPADGQTSLEYELETQVVPEPTTLAIYGIGALGAGLVAYRKKKRAAVA